MRGSFSVDLADGRRDVIALDRRPLLEADDILCRRHCRFAGDDDDVMLAQRSVQRSRDPFPLVPRRSVMPRPKDLFFEISKWHMQSADGPRCEVFGYSGIHQLTVCWPRKACVHLAIFPLWLPATLPGLTNADQRSLAVRVPCNGLSVHITIAIGVANRTLAMTVSLG